MADSWKQEKWAQAEEFWYSGKTTRRRFLGFGAAAAGALGATVAVPAWWKSAFGQAKPYRLGTLQPLSGTAAAGGKTALVGVQMAVDRIIRTGGLNGRPIELFIGDYESKPDVGRRRAEKLVLEDKIDFHVGGYLSNVCLACMPVYEEHRVLNMVSVCLDTTITTTKCSRYSFRAFDYAPAQAVAFAPHLVSKMGKKWHIVYLDYAWGQSTRDAYIEQIKKAGGETVETTGVPLSTADMTAFLSKIQGNFDGIFAILFGGPAVTRADVLHVRQMPGATVVMDLSAPLKPGLEESFDCIVLTQTLQFIFDIGPVIANLYRLLKPGGVLLATCPGISQLSRGDLEQFGEFWRLTTQSATRLFIEFFPMENLSVEAHGNVLAAIGMLHGLAVEDLSIKDLEVHDPDYEVIISVRALKAG